MKELLTALGLVFVIEGAFLSLFPQRAIKMAESIRLLSVNDLRIAGISAAILGFLVIAVMRVF